MGRYKCAEYRLYPAVMRDLTQTVVPNNFLFDPQKEAVKIWWQSRRFHLPVPRNTTFTVAIRRLRSAVALDQNYRFCQKLHDQKSCSHCERLPANGL